MATTLTNLRDTFYDILREEQDTSAYPLDFVDLLLNTAQQKICYWRVVNPLTKEEARKWTLPFLLTDKFYSSVWYTSLNGALTVWDTTVTVTDASNFPSSWAIYINWEVVTYTGTTATTFTWCSSIAFAHATGASVYPVYTLPTGFASVVTVIYNHRYKLENQVYDDIFENNNSFKWSDYRRNTTRWPFSEPYRQRPFYAIKDDTYLITYNLDDNDLMIHLRYEKSPTTMSAGSDTATISNDLFAKTTIPYLAVGEMLYNRWEEGRAGEILNFAIGQVREMYTFYNNTTSEKLSWKQYKIGKWKINL